jgi:hypothetical protein
LEGHFVFGDQVSHKFWSFKYDGENLTDFVDRTDQLANPFLANYIGAPLFGMDAEGEIYAIDWTGGDIFKIIADPFPADYNHDGKISAADYTVWRDAYGSTTTLDADGNGNGVVDDSDFELWRDSYGDTLDSEASASVLVPEPGTFGLMIAVLVLLPSAKRFIDCRRSLRT